MVVRPKMAQVHDSIDLLLKYVDVTASWEIQGHYHLSHRELIIRDQYQNGKQLKLDSFFKPTPVAHESNPDSPPTPPPLSPTPDGAAALPLSHLPSPSTASEEFIGLQ